MYAEYLKPVLEKKDIYWKVDQSDYGIIESFVEAGIDVVLDGESITGKFDKMLKDDTMAYIDIEDVCFPKYITRELDARVFDESKVRETFQPKSKDFLKWIEENAKYAALEEITEWYPAVKNILYVENDNPDFWDCCRRPPIYLLWKIAGKWYFRRTLPPNNPSYICMLLHTAFSPEELAYDIKKGYMNWELTEAAKQELKGVMRDGIFHAEAVEEVFALVLNADETCDAMHYWKQIAFYLKYDRAKGVIEICEKNTAMLEFHRTLQQSIDLLTYC